MILLEYDKDVRNLIGIVVANNNLRESYYKNLQEIEVKRNFDKPIISSYCSGNNVTINFSLGGIVVLNDKSIKGLEFDVVYIVLDGFHIYNNDIDSMKKRFYVMSSRAIKKLVFLQSKDSFGNIEELLPHDQSILKIIEVKDEKK